MAKYYGKIGFEVTNQTRPGIWESTITERFYRGDVVRNIRRLGSRDQINDDIDISNEFSILMDPFAKDNFHQMRYIEYMGTKWRITSVEVQYPRLILSVGGVYNVEE